MGRKKLPGGPQAEAPVQLKPFCYYCDKEFNDDKLLVQHQRTKHFNCSECGLKFDTVTGLRVHMLNAYKKTMKEVPNAIPGRENPDIVVHGMEGLPKGIVEAKMQTALAEYNAREKVREEENRERQAKRAAEAKEAGIAEEPEDAPEPPPPPPGAGRRQPSPPPAPRERMMERFPEPPPRAPQPQVPVSVPRPQPQAPAASFGQAAMAGVSPAVAKLLQGTGQRPPESGDTGAPVLVPGVPGHMVPKALSGLHPIALQALGAAGMLLPPPKMYGMEPDEKRMRMTVMA